jgi:nucleoside-diphosphate-sugar epimerase
MSKNSELAREVSQRFQRAVVTGGAGFIGSHIVEALLPSGIDVVAVDDLSSGKRENIAPFETLPNFRFCQTDVSDEEALEEAMDGADIVFHNAASKKNVCLVDPRRDLAVNGGGAFNVFDIAHRTRIKKVIHASTGSVYGEPRIFPQTEDHPLDPVSYYGVSKLAGERYGLAYHKLYGLDVSVLRYFHVYGPRQEWHDEFGGVVSIFLRRALSGQNLIVHGDGDQQRSFTNVDDVVQANLVTAVHPDASGQAYNCASSIKVTVKELAHFILQKVGNEGVDIEHGPPLIGDIRRFDVSNDKIAALGVQFERDVWRGLVPTIDWMTNRLRMEGA